MIIYGEYLFLENLITGMMILFFTGKILGERISRWRLLFCGVCCGLYAFCLFTPTDGIFSLIRNFLFSIVMVFLAFGKKAPKRLVKYACMFLLMTILYGGVAIAILTSFGWTGVTAASGVYLPPMTYFSVTAVAACSAGLLGLFINLLKTRRMEAKTRVDAEIRVEGKIWTLKGFLDSGNVLKEPLTGRPVCIVRKALMDELLQKIEHPENRYTVIPYQAVGTQRGILEGYRADEVSIDGTSLRSPILAICEEQTFFGENNELEILLPGIMLERGIHGDYWSN